MTNETGLQFDQLPEEVKKGIDQAALNISISTLEHIRRARNEAFEEAAGLAKASSLTWNDSRDMCRASAVRALDALEHILRTCIEPDRISEKGKL